MGANTELEKELEILFIEIKERFLKNDLSSRVILKMDKDYTSILLEILEGIPLDIKKAFVKNHNETLKDIFNGFEGKTPEEIASVLRRSEVMLMNAVRENFLYRKPTDRMLVLLRSVDAGTDVNNEVYIHNIITLMENNRVFKVN